jgi:type I restriction enzyme M protein
MNMVMNNDGSGNLEQADSLANPHTWSEVARKVAPFGQFDIVFTNPPFGVNNIIDDTDILSQYDLGAVWDFKDSRWQKRLDKSGNVVLQSSQPPEILFIERCIRFLQPGSGRMAMVVPNGILNNPTYAYIRQWITDNTQVLAVVDMARDLFQPRNDTQTSMVLMRRLTPEERELASSGLLSYECFMAVTERVGHDKRGNTIYRRNENGEDILVEHEEQVDSSALEASTDQVPSITVLDRLIDDELPEAAAAYRTWAKRAAAL